MRGDRSTGIDKGRRRSAFRQTGAIGSRAAALDGTQSAESLGGIVIDLIDMSERPVDQSPRDGTIPDDVLVRNLADVMPDGIVVVDSDGRIVYVNRECERIFGYSRDELIGRDIEILVPERAGDTHRAHRQAYWQAPLRRPMALHLELTGRRRDGTELPVEISLNPVTTAQGMVVVASIRDVSERRALEQALRKSESLSHGLVEQAPDAVFIADIGGRYLEVNVPACRLLGYTREELVGKAIEDVIPADDVSRLQQARELLLQPDQVQVGEWTLLRKDGTSVFVEVSAKIYPDGRWVAFVRDISERKRSEAALRRSQEALARAQRVAHLGSWEWDVRTNVVERSNELFALFGLEPAAAAPVRWSMRQYLHPDDRERVANAVDAAAVEGRGYAIEHRIIRADGAERIVVQQGEPVLENGVTVRIVGTLVDMTELRRAEIARQTSLRWFRATFENSPIGLLLVRATEPHRVEANPRANAIFGRAIERMADYEDLVFDASGASVPLHQFPSQRALRGEPSGWDEYIVRKPTGESVSVLWGAAPIVEESGRIEGAVVTLHDITPVKELERLRAEWSSVVAHDLRQPLSTILLHTEALLRTVTEAGVRKNVDRIQTAAKRLERMTGDLMDLSRLEARRLELAPRKLDLAALVQGLIEQTQAEAPDRTIDLHTRGELREVTADPDRMAQVLENLLSNAVKYGDARAPIVVEIEGAPETVSVAVTNSGPGIAAEDIPRLFQRFQRTNGGRKPGVKSVGLGLYITRELVEAHGGQISVTSIPGATTTFRFTVPWS